MSERSATLETLDKEYIYSVCAMMKQDVVHILNTLKMVYSNLTNLIKMSQGILRIWRYAVLAFFYLLHAYPKQQGVDRGCYRRTPSPIVCIGISTPLLGKFSVYFSFLWPTLIPLPLPPSSPATKNWIFQWSLTI